MSNSALQLSGLRFTYPSSKIPLTFADYELSRSSIGLISGPSGCGKSSLLALLAGLLQPQAGKITLQNSDGQSTDICQLSGAQMDAYRSANIGFVPQRLLLASALTVLQNLQLARFGQHAQGSKNRAVETTARAHYLLAQLGIGELANQRVTRISGGQAQRVAVARALMNKPSLVLADEPTANLDDANSEQVISLLVTACKDNGATLLIASHDARVAAALPQAERLQLKAQSA
jgi:putative ABC transport system ATP-binding protein